MDARQRNPTMGGTQNSKNAHKCININASTVPCCRSCRSFWLPLYMYICVWFFPYIGQTRNTCNISNNLESEMAQHVDFPCIFWSVHGDEFSGGFLPRNPHHIVHHGGQLTVFFVPRTTAMINESRCLHLLSEIGCVLIFESVIAAPVLIPGINGCGS